MSQSHSAVGHGTGRWSPASPARNTARRPRSSSSSTCASSRPSPRRRPRFEHELAEGHVGHGDPRLRDGVLRDLVGLDELHLVRLRVRHRRRPVPAAHAGPDHRRAGPGRRARPRRSSTRTSPSSPGATSSCGWPWSPSGCAPPAPTPNDGAPALRYAVGILIVQIGWVARLALPEDWGLPSFAVLVAGRDRRPRLGRERGHDHLAPAPHRRAVRPVHPHRPRRDHDGGHRGRPYGPRRRDGARRHRDPGHRRRTDGVRPVVAVLRAERPPTGSPASRSALLLGLRPLRSSSPRPPRSAPGWR